MYVPNDIWITFIRTTLAETIFVRTTFVRTKFVSTTYVRITFMRTTFVRTAFICIIYYFRNGTKVARARDLRLLPCFQIIDFFL